LCTFETHYYLYMEFRTSGGFSLLPVVVKNLLIINALLYLGKLSLPIDLDRWLAFWHWELANQIRQPIDFFEPHQIFTYMFMHGNFIHLLFNMFVLWMFGKELENALGSKKFINFYLICGLISCVVYAIMPYAGFGSFGMMLGASGAVYGILVGFGMMYPNMQLMLLFPPIPIKAKYLVGIYIALDVFLGFSGTNTGIAHFAHLGGALGGFLLMKFWLLKGR